MIAFCCHLDDDQIQIGTDRSLQKEIEHQLQDIYPDLPLLLHTTIFIRCLSLLQDQQIIGKCLQNLLNKCIDANQRDRQVVYEALSPYLQSNTDFLAVTEYKSNNFSDHYRGSNNKSSILNKYLNISSDESPSVSLLISNMYLANLARDFHEHVTAGDRHLLKSYCDPYTTDRSIPITIFQAESSVLTVAQVLMVTNILLFASSSNRSEDSKKFCVTLSNALHHISFAEFKACCLLESWIKWKDSSELSSFAYHAALLLANSDLWSVEAMKIVCDLLCCENDRFRQRAELIFRSVTDHNDIRRSSKMGINVLLTLTTKRAHYVHISPSANLTLWRMFEDTIVHIRSHLNTFLWLERYRVHALNNKEYSFNMSKLLTIPYATSLVPNYATMDLSFCDNIRRMSDDLIEYMCDLIRSNFSSFLEIDGDTTSDAILESHVQFFVSVLVCLVAFILYEGEIRLSTINALITLIETSRNNEIRRAAAYALGYICDKRTYKILFNQLEIVVNKETTEISSDSDSLISALVSSYCHCVSVYDIVFSQNHMDLFCKLLKHPSPNVLRALHVGLGRILKNNSRLFQMLDANYIQGYHVLINSTPYVLAYDVRQTHINAVAEFIDEHPDLLSIFVVELYNSIRHFTNDVLHLRTIDFYLAYGKPGYVDVAGLVSIRMPAAFCAYIRDCGYGDNLKRALFYSSKQHSFPQRAACLTILSVFGELTVELCEMIIAALRDDPHIQNTCYKCLTRINSIKDEKVVFNLLCSYLKSKSINVRYAASKILLHLSQSSLVPSDQVRKALNELMIGDASGTIRRNELNDIDLDFVQSEKASRLSSCLYEKKREENLEIEKPSKIKSVD